VEKEKRAINGGEKGEGKNYGEQERGRRGAESTYLN